MMGGIGQMLFGMIFNALLMFLFAPKPKDTVNYGPRLDNLKPAVKDIQGQVINLTYGITRVSGTVFWASDIRETVHKDVTEYSGGKGGSGYTHTDITYTYDCDLAVGICEGEIVGIRKIWANKELIYNQESNPSTVSWLKYDLFVGSETQSPSSVLQAAHGRTYTPAHRGLAYIVFKEFQLDPFGRRVPQSIEFEVVAKGVVGSASTKYPQFDYTKWTDYGNDIYEGTRWQPLIMLDPYTIHIGNLSSNTNLEYAKINIITGAVTKYYYPIQYSIWCGSGNRQWWAMNPQQSMYIFPYVTFMGTGRRRIPVLLRNGYINTESGAVPQYSSAYMTYNLINNKPIEFLMGDGYGGGNTCPLGGDFVFHQGDVAFNATNVCWGAALDRFDDMFTRFIRPVSDVGAVDEYGFNKEMSNRIIDDYGWCGYGYQWIKSTPYSNDPNHLNTSPQQYIRASLIGFPEYTSTQTDTHKTEIFYTHEFTSIMDSSLFYIDYEGYTLSPYDNLEKDLGIISRVKQTKRTVITRLIDNYVTSDTTSIITLKCPSHFTTFTPAERTIDYESVQKHTTAYDYAFVMVYYIEGLTEDFYNANQMRWIRQIDGTEILFYPISNTEIRVYRKSNFNVDLITTFEEYVEWLNDPTMDIVDQTFGWYEYSQSLPEIVYDEVYPSKNVWFTEKDYLLDPLDKDYLTNSTGWKYKFGQNKLALTPYPFKYVQTIPDTTQGFSTFHIWDGKDYIYWKRTTDGKIYRYYLSTDAWEYVLTPPVYITAFFPYGNGFIGTDLHRTGYYPYTGSVANVYLIKEVITGDYALLGEIIIDISNKAGINQAILDISTDAYNVKVRGYNISDDIKLIDALSTLLMHYFIDAFESDWKIKFRTRKEYLKTSTNMPQISNDELGVKYINDDYNIKYKVVLREDIELPQSLSYTYIAAENGFVQSNIIAIRNIDFNLGIKTSVKCPIALLTTEAYSNAFRLLFDIWRSVREYEFRLPKTYSYIEPGDIVLLPTGASESTNEYNVVKIVEVIAESNAYLEVKALDEDARNLEDFIIDGTYEKEKNTLISVSSTQGGILDISPLYNKYTNIDYNNPGVYVYTYATDKLWRGGSLYMSEDNITYARYINFSPFSASVGTVLGVSNYKVYNREFVERLNYITISVDSAETFYSNDDNDITYREGNLLAIYSRSTGNIEFVQFNKITEDAENSNIITLSRFQRGLYNSPITNIVVGDIVILLVPVGIEKFNLDSSYYEKYLYYKMVSLNQYPETADTFRFQYNLNWYKPYNICNGVANLSGSDVVISWNSRERNKPMIILHTPEIIDTYNYKIEIYDVNNILVNTIEDITSNSYTYTNALLTSDGFTISDKIKFVITRKMPVINYDHGITDSIIYEPRSYIEIMQDISTSLLMYKQFGTDITTNIIPDYDKNATIVGTYNNYNGLSHPYVGKSVNKQMAIGSLHYKHGDLITFNNVTYGSSPQYQSTVVAVFRISEVPGSTYVNESVLFGAGDGTYDTGLHALTYKNTSGTRSFRAWVGKDTLTLSGVVPGKWYFAVLCNNATNGQCCAAAYIGALDGYHSAKAAYSTWPGDIVQNQFRVGFTESTGWEDLQNVEVQEVILFDRNLYMESGNNWTKIDKLLEEVRNKWLLQ